MSGLESNLAPPRSSSASKPCDGRDRPASDSSQTEFPRYVFPNLKDVLGPYRRAEDLSRYEEGLRQAGLPE
jgi:hypothetical protein